MSIIYAKAIPNFYGDMMVRSALLCLTLVSAYPSLAMNRLTRRLSAHLSSHDRLMNSTAAVSPSDSELDTERTITSDHYEPILSASEKVFPHKHQQAIEQKKNAMAIVKYIIEKSSEGDSDPQELRKLFHNFNINTHVKRTTGYSDGSRTICIWTISTVSTSYTDQNAIALLRKLQRHSEDRKIISTDSNKNRQQRSNTQ